jgi:hypothetical protein
MRTWNSALASCFLLAVPVAAVQASQQDACPSPANITIKAGTACEGYEGCEYDITSAAGNRWTGSDPSETGKDGKAPIRFLSAVARKAPDGSTQVFCDYGFDDDKGELRKTGGFRLSLEPPAKITLTDKWKTVSAQESPCESKEASQCAFVK